jgi:hypothetical protein
MIHALRLEKSSISSMMPAHPVIETIARRSRARIPGVGACVLLLLLASPALLSVWGTVAIYRADLPTDEDLAANFSEHAALFDELIHMIGADRQALWASERESVALIELDELLGHERQQQYAEILKDMSVRDFQLELPSGDLALLPQGARGDAETATKTYLYRPQGDPEPLERYHGYGFRGPGTYLVTGDHPLSKGWSVHHRAMLQIAFSPY